MIDLIITACWTVVVAGSLLLSVSIITAEFPDE